MFTKIDYMLSQKTCLKFQNIEIILSMFPDHIAIKLEMNNNKISFKNVSLNKPWIKEESQEKF